MNDYTFGNRLWALRRQAGLTQQEAANKLGVTNKAVSKWETGKSKPSINALRQLAALYHVSVEELLTLREEAPAPLIRKIVITGGPCAGKTTAMSWVQNAFGARGWQVLFVPETATELITGGVAPWTCGSNLEYQRCQLTLQLEKEAIFLAAAKTMQAKKVLIVCDRGALDNKAYMTAQEFAALTEELRTGEVLLRDGYDSVFHLVTAAKGAEAFYTNANNQARRETPQQAAALDDKLIAAWTGHPHLRIIDNSTGFEDKMKRLIAEIALSLGEPEPQEIERKFLIKKPDVALLAQARPIEIMQTYLKSAPEEEVRVRQRGDGRHFVYYKTVKRPVNALTRVETEERLTEKEYLRLLMEADSSRRPIRKTRYCLTYENQYFEIDLYPSWEEEALMEIELPSETAPVKLPPFLKILREVTGEEAYTNAALAKA